MIEPYRSGHHRRPPRSRLMSPRNRLEELFGKCWCVRPFQPQNRRLDAANRGRPPCPGHPVRVTDSCHHGSPGWSCACLLCCVCGLCPVVVVLEKLVEQRAVMNERLTLLLGARIPVSVGEMNGVSRSVVFDNSRMIDRDVGCTLIEIVNRITALTHHLGEKSVRVVQCTRGVVDECSLD